MHLESALVEIETAVDDQVRIGAPGLAQVAGELMTALRPALEKTLLGVVQDAATEVSAQLLGQRVEVHLEDGQPRLVVTDDSTATGPDREEEFEARVTLRLPPSLKTLVEESAASAGESMNGWVVDALRNRTGRRRPGHRVEETFDL